MLYKNGIKIKKNSPAVEGCENIDEYRPEAAETLATFNRSSLNLGL